MYNSASFKIALSDSPRLTISPKSPNFWHFISSRGTEWIPFFRSINTTNLSVLNFGCCSLSKKFSNCLKNSFSLLGERGHSLLSPLTRTHMVVLALPFHTLRNMNLCTFVAPSGFFQSLWSLQRLQWRVLSLLWSPNTRRCSRSTALKTFPGGTWPFASFLTFCQLLLLHYFSTTTRPEESIFIHHLWNEERR